MGAWLLIFLILRFKTRDSAVIFSISYFASVIAILTESGINGEDNERRID